MGSRAVARARSLSSGRHVPEISRAQASDPLGSLGAVGKKSLLFNDIEVAGFARRPRMPVGLPRGLTAAVAAAAINRGDDGKPGGRAGTLWKAVPIKVMNFDFC